VGKFGNCPTTQTEKSDWHENTVLPKIPLVKLFACFGRALGCFILFHVNDFLNDATRYGIFLTCASICPIIFFGAANELDGEKREAPNFAVHTL
jgi:hypothetical protein